MENYDKDKDQIFCGKETKNYEEEKLESSSEKEIEEEQKIEEVKSLAEKRFDYENFVTMKSIQDLESSGFEVLKIEGESFPFLLAFCGEVKKRTIGVEILADQGKGISKKRKKLIRHLQAKDIDCFEWIPNIGFRCNDNGLFGLLKPIQNKYKIKQEIKKEEAEKNRLLKPGIPKEATQKLLDEWARLSGRSQNKVKLTKKRLELVRSRLREGYELVDLRNAIAGVCYSQYHRENGYDTIDFALRSGENVEKCVGYWERLCSIEELDRIERKFNVNVSIRKRELDTYRVQNKQQKESSERLRKLLEEREKERIEKEEQERKEKEEHVIFVAKCMAEVAADEEAERRKKQNQNPEGGDARRTRGLSEQEGLEV